MLCKLSKQQKLWFIIYCLLVISCYSLYSSEDPIQKLKKLLPPTPDVKLDWTEIEKIPVSYEGRIVPFITFAQDTLFFLYGKTKYGKESATDFIIKSALFSTILGLNHAKDLKIISIQNYRVKKELELPTEKNYFSLEDLKNKLEIIFKLATNIEQKKQRKEKLLPLENQIYLVYDKILTLEKIVSGNFYFLYDSKTAKWYNLYELETLKNDVRFENLYKGIVALSVAILRESFDKANKIITKEISPQLKKLNNVDAKINNVHLEYLYIKYNLLHKASFLFLIGLIFSIIHLISHNKVVFKYLSIFFSIAGFLSEVCDIIVRANIASRAPVSSFYESIFYIASAIFLFSFIFYIIFKNYKILFCGTLLNTIILLLSSYTGLNPHIKVLMPALRSYWLIYHVHTITISYALFAISFVLGHWILAQYLIKNFIDSELVHILYNSVKIGVIFLAIGIMLGSIWGSEAWGRYWGWDPKETWALITLLGYLAIIHLKKAKTIELFGISMGAILSFYLVGITYYGASFIFVGLHSYAGDNIGDFLPIWLIGIIAVETIFIISSIYVHSNRLLKTNNTQTAKDTG